MTEQIKKQNTIPEAKSKRVRKGFVWLVKPTIWRNKWNVDEAAVPSAPAGMRVKDLTSTYKRLKESSLHESVIKEELEERLAVMSDREAYEFYVQVEELSDTYQNHRRQSLRVKGWISYLLSFAMLVLTFMLGTEISLSVIVGKAFSFFLFILLMGQGFVSFYRAEQIRQRRMFDLFHMFETPSRFIY